MKNVSSECVIGAKNVSFLLYHVTVAVFKLSFLSVIHFKVNVSRPVSTRAINPLQYTVLRAGQGLESSEGFPGLQPLPDTSPHDDVCAVCGEEGNLLCCDFCPKTHHLDCLVPRMQSLPKVCTCFFGPTFFPMVFRNSCIRLTHPVYWMFCHSRVRGLSCFFLSTKAPFSLLYTSFFFETTVRATYLSTLCLDYLCNPFATLGCC